jgi:hypothetical protein
MAQQGHKPEQTAPDGTPLVDWLSEAVKRKIDRIEHPSIALAQREILERMTSDVRMQRSGPCC